ncbi:autotransporter assembly complex protein TamA [Sphingomonas qomolangmaensis]|uniref:Autotransporter assembly complex protein TamA n=1 Tax=Sphingomonas qomolangmaensis TaxID=2918765 RepID=A0ABY5L767_9SPHN|nr:autotransporter assembly complex family protein [Sphingomonas qomolangmaensis]UUL81453.1 autotransporter assembly complex protein TamA [Sphingomonas qomolangmaensis]
MSLVPRRRCWRAAVAGLLVLSPAVSRAQTATTPDAAAPASAQDDDLLDPDAPLMPMPELGIAWPDLALAPGETATAETAIDDGTGEARYRYQVEGMDAVWTELMRQRFDEGSILRANRNKPANAAQIDRRARADSTLLGEVLRAEGYYDARIDTRVEPAAGELLVTLEVVPGPVYRLERVDVAGLAAAGAKQDELRQSFDVDANDPVNADAIAAAETALRTRVGREGFPFAEVGEPRVVVDHATQTATLSMDVQPGELLRFGRVTMRDARVFDAEHVLDIARFEPGDVYDSNSVEDLRRAIIQTGIVSAVRIEEVKGQAPGTVDLDMRIVPGPPRTIAGELGYGTGEGARAEVSWTHRNLFPPEGGLTLRGVLGTREQLGSVVFRRNNFHGRDRVLTLQMVAAHLERDAFVADTFQLSGSLERQTNIFFQKAWTWSLGAELLASNERDVILATGEPRERIYFIGALPTSLAYDGSDDLLNPTRGFRLSGRLSPEVSFSGATFGYARTQLDASAYHPFNDRVVVAGRVRLGTIVGAPRDAVAPSRRFYAGGGASVRGYGFQDIGPRDQNNDPIGGRSLTEFSIEARVKAFGAFGIVPFLDGGNIYTSPLPKFTDFRYGAGIGVRYYSNFGPIRIDVGTPLNPQPGDPRVAVYVSLGQAF